MPPAPSSASSSPNLPKIGPGLGSRQRIWERVQAKIFNETYPANNFPFSNNLHPPVSIESQQHSAQGRYPSTPYYASNLQPPPATPIASSFIPLINEKERRLLQNLANSHNLPTHSSGSKSSNKNSNSAWLEFIPTELIGIYYAIYGEMKVLPISEKEIMKIDKDVPRTFGLFARHARHLRLNFPADMSPYYDALKSILCAISYERGYCQGINFIVAAMLIQYPHEKQVYTILAYLLKYQHVGILFDPRYSSLLDYMRLFEKKLRKHNRNVYNHFKKCDFTTVSYAIEWFTTCFIVSSPGELSLCILDLLIAGFDNIMIRVGLSLLDFLEEKILQLDFEGLHQKFKFLMTNADPIIIMANAIKMKLDTEVNYLQIMAQKIESMDPSQGGNLQFSRRTAISGRRYSEILISPMKIEDDDENEKRQQEEDSSKLNNDSSKQEQSSDVNRSNAYESCLADDEASPPSIHKLMRVRALNDRKEKKEDHQQQQQSRLRSLRSLRRTPATSSKKKPTFTNQPTMHSITPNEKLLLNSPNSPIPYNGEAYTYNVPMTPFAPPLYPNQFNLTSDPAMYQTTNVTPQNNWWNASAWKSSLVSSFKGVSKLFQPGNTVNNTDSGPTLTSNNINATVGDLNLQSAVVISSGNAVVIPQSTPPRNGAAVAMTAPPPVTAGKVKPVDDLEFDSAIILSDSDFSSDVSESKQLRYRKNKKRRDMHHGQQRFRNRKLINFLYDNLYNSINNTSLVNNGASDSNGIMDSDNAMKESVIDRCSGCGCEEDKNYFGDGDLSVTHAHSRDRESLFNGKTNVRVIKDVSSSSVALIDGKDNQRSSVSSVVIDRADDEGETKSPQNAYMENSMIAMVLTHHLHESWFNADGKKISKVNIKFRHYHCSKLSLSEVAKKLVKGHIQVCEEDFITI